MFSKKKEGKTKVETNASDEAVNECMYDCEVSLLFLLSRFTGYKWDPGIKPSACVNPVIYLWSKTR